MALAFERGTGWSDGTALGLVVLQADETIEPEFRRLFAASPVALYHTRVPSGEALTLDTLRAMETALPQAVGILPKSVTFDAIGYACTSGATIIGERRVADLIRSVHPTAAVTNPLTAAKAAFQALSVARLAFLTPYIADVSVAMRRNLEAGGIAIASFGSFEQSDEATVARIAPQSIFEAACDIGTSPDCDAVFIACTNLQTADMIAAAEKRLGKPVISSNQALAWHMSRLAGHDIGGDGGGRLLRLTLPC